jgi:hypothetical protein
MSRSKKEPIIKERPRNHRKSTEYWRRVRRVINQTVRKLFYKDEDEVVIPNPKEVVNDYDYSDYTFDMRDISKPSDREKLVKKASRK